MGHVIECLSLERSLSRHARCRTRFLTRRGTQGAAFLKAQGCRCEELDAICEADELRELGATLRREVPDLLIVNLRDASVAYYEALKGLAPYLVAIFDGGERLPLNADQIVHYGISQPSAVSRRDAAVGTAWLLGPSFALLDEDVRRYRVLPRPTRRVCQRIFVNQGGSDPYGLTLKILQALKHLQVQQEVIVVLGPAVTPALTREVEALQRSLPFRCRVERSLSTARVYELMSESDLAVTAAGNTLYELCAIGVPSLVVCHHERHDAVAGAFEAKGAVKNLGIGTAVSIEAIAEGIRDLLENDTARAALSQHGTALVDGLGCVRVASEIIAGVAARRCESSLPALRAI